MKDQLMTAGAGEMISILAADGWRVDEAGDARKDAIINPNCIRYEVEETTTGTWPRINFRAALTQ
jgi:hypothetical protein